MAKIFNAVCSNFLPKRRIQMPMWTGSENAYTFSNENLTCLLFPFDGVQLDVGKLAMWRLETRETFGSTWLSDYVDNRLNGFISEPTVESVQTEDYEESEGFETC